MLKTVKKVYVHQGLTHLQYTLLRLAVGMGRPGRYFEYAVQFLAMEKIRVKDSDFRPLFVQMLRKGLLVLVNENQLAEQFKARQYKVTDKGWEALCDVEISKGGDYTFYKEFDGTASGLTKFESKAKVGVQTHGTNANLIKAALKNMSPSARAKFKNANPRWANVG